MRALSFFLSLVMMLSRGISGFAHSTMELTLEESIRIALEKTLAQLKSVIKVASALTRRKESDRRKDLRLTRQCVRQEV